jgi:nicotinamide phosphoribosyltransferase
MFIQGINPILNSDGYVHGMERQIPPGMTAGYAYQESRGGRYAETLFFGHQAVKAYLRQPVTRDHVDEAVDFFGPYGVPFDRTIWDDIVLRHDGFMPIRIDALPEGSVVPTGNALMTIQTTDAEHPWVHNFIEAPLLRSTWYAMTVATTSWQAKRIIKHYLEETSDDPDGELPFKLHDFGARAASSLESAALGGMAHLVNFRGTDTLSGIVAASMFYGAKHPGNSIPASAHCTMTSWGRDGEVHGYRNMLRQFGRPGKIFACVSDAYDIWNAVANIWGGELREQVIASGATVVIRPDSGDPIDTPIRCIEMLGERFGFTVNSKGYRVLNHVRVIQGDGIDVETIRQILWILQQRGWSATNIAFGMGGKLLHAGLDRDTQRVAQKQAAALINGNWVDTFKDPVGDKGKRSKAGLLAVTHDNDNNEWQTVPMFEANAPDWLEPTYDTGWFSPDVTFETVQRRANSYL